MFEEIYEYNRHKNETGPYIVHIRAKVSVSHQDRRFISHRALAGSPHQGLISPHWGQKGAILKFLNGIKHPCRNFGEAPIGPRSGKMWPR